MRMAYYKRSCKPEGKLLHQPVGRAVQPKPETPRLKPVLLRSFAAPIVSHAFDWEVECVRGFQFRKQNSEDEALTFECVAGTVLILGLLFAHGARAQADA